MPSYVVNGMHVHIKMSGKAQLPCCAVVERDGRRQRCAGISSMLCDYPLTEGGTCDAPLCADHAHQVGQDRHLCQIHRALEQHGQREMFS